MLTWVFIIILLLALVAWMLWTPLVLNIDTVQQRYYLKLTGVVKASLEPHAQKVARLRIDVLFFHFYVDFLQNLGKPSTKKLEDAKKPSKRRFKLNLNQMLALWRSFTLKRFYLNMDTGDVVLNAQLYPIFFFLDRRYGGFHINFEDRNQMVLQLENRPIRLLKIFINSKT
ncbi:MAG: hypothetical protein HKP38_00365 [Croceitalea sp.]|nr:hypothetical protein [Croceitalea sp.]